MATLNPFGLLGDDDAEDPLQLLAAQQKAAAPTPARAPAQLKKGPVKTEPEAKLPTKPAPPAQADLADLTNKKKVLQERSYGFSSILKKTLGTQVRSEMKSGDLSDIDIAAVSILKPTHMILDWLQYCCHVNDVRELTVFHLTYVLNVFFNIILKPTHMIFKFLKDFLLVREVG
ncbi:RNA binding protein [Striga asiatica]|uniref:RNA binding protein n=1 Tax=Striga asiatica TaxID=4170 RepID=A0A5A7QJJ2_STRAF|nr:RNA binding protein [Striga asiatica]